jgi:hypothetical protein
MSGPPDRINQNYQAQHSPAPHPEDRQQAQHSPAPHPEDRQPDQTPKSRHGCGVTWFEIIVMVVILVVVDFVSTWHVGRNARETFSRVSSAVSTPSHAPASPPSSQPEQGSQRKR